VCQHWVKVLALSDAAKALQVLGQSWGTVPTVIGQSLGSHWALLFAREHPATPSI